MMQILMMRFKRVSTHGVLANLLVADTEQAGEFFNAAGDVASANGTVVGGATGGPVVHELLG